MGSNKENETPSSFRQKSLILCYFSKSDILMPMSDKKKPIKTVPGTEAKLTWQPHKTFELEITIPWPKVKKAYDQVLEETAKTISIKGFRQGKAPKKMVEEQVGKQALYEKVVQKVVVAQYVEALKNHQLRPIINPKISVVKIKEGEDWLVKAAACERPEIKLGQWQETVRGVKAQAKIWTPKSGEPALKPEEKPEASPEADQQKLSKIFEALLKEVQVDLSPLLVEEETNRILSGMIDQVNKLGMTVDQYLNSKKITSDQFRSQQQQQAEQTLKLEFILAEIAEEMKLAADENEVKQAIEAVKDEKDREKLKSPEQKAYIASVLRKRKTIDYLLGL